MKKIIAMSAMAILLMNSVDSDTRAQVAEDGYSTIRNTSCISAIHRVHSDIENRIGGAVGDVTYYDPSRQMSDSPYEKSNARIISPIRSRQMQIKFVLLSTMSRGRQASIIQEGKNSSIVSSLRLTKKYTYEIIAACTDVGSVRFWLWEYGVSWSVDGSGQITRDRCVDSETWQRRPLVWGEMLCT